MDDKNSKSRAARNRRSSSKQSHPGLSRAPEHRLRVNQQPAPHSKEMKNDSSISRKKRSEIKTTHNLEQAKGKQEKASFFRRLVSVQKKSRSVEDKERRDVRREVEYTSVSSQDNQRVQSKKKGISSDGSKVEPFDTLESSTNERENLRQSKRPDQEERKNQKKKRCSLRKLLILDAAIAILILAVLTGHFVFNHRFFRIKYARVNGNSTISTARIIATAGNLNQNIFRFSASEAEKAIGSLEGIKSVAVHRKLPNEIQIDIEETYPIATAQIKGKTWYLGDTGEWTEEPVVPESDFYRYAVYPIEGFSNIDALRKAWGKDERLQQFMEAMRDLDHPELVTKILFEKDGNIAIIYGGTTVHFGAPDDIRSKLGTMQSILVDLTARGQKATDIQHPNGVKTIVELEGENE